MSCSYIAPPLEEFGLQKHIQSTTTASVCDGLYPSPQIAISPKNLIRTYTNDWLVTCSHATLFIRFMNNFP